MASTAVSTWTDAAVVQYRILRWDHQVLTTHGYPMKAYQDAHEQFRRIGPRSKPETKVALEATYVTEKRKLIERLLELRKEQGQAIRDDPTIAGAAVAASSGAAEKSGKPH